MEAKIDFEKQIEAFKRQLRGIIDNFFAVPEQNPFHLFLLEKLEAEIYKLSPIVECLETQWFQTKRAFREVTRFATELEAISRDLMTR